MTISKNNSISGIILSGGVSSRFQTNKEPWQDKALFVINGKTMLEKAIDLHLEICDEVLIVVNNTERIDKYSKILKQYSTDKRKKVSIITDSKEILSKGPTLGLLTGIFAANFDTILVTPVDMPKLKADFLKAMLARKENYPLLIPYFPERGKIEPLVLVLQKNKLKDITNILKNIRKSRADDIIRACLHSKFLAISNSQLSIIQDMFRSFNNREQIKTNFNSRKLVVDELFDEEKSIIITNNIDKLILSRVVHFLDENKFIKVTGLTLKFLDIISKALLKSKYYYLAGILLMEFFNQIPRKSFSQKKEMYNIYSDLTEACVKAFIEESIFWNKNKLNFLEYHAKLDALEVAKISENISIKNDFAKRIEKMKKEMELKKDRELRDFDSEIMQKMKPLIDKTKKLINQSESEFNKKQPIYDTEFLWEHSLRVGKIAYFIAKQEGEDPLIPTLGAIFHDAGKFVLGNYHKDEQIEEEQSAILSEKLLLEFGINKKNISKIMTSITALYNENLTCDKHCKIIHDADRLEKLGSLGIANFFTKSTLRGSTLIESIIKNLSRELTYIHVSPKTMLTKTGTSLAKSRKEIALNYFYHLIDELELYDIDRFKIQKFGFEEENEIYLVLPEKCRICDGQYYLDFNSKEGLKCKQVLVDYICNKCEDNFTINFCLPILASK